MVEATLPVPPRLNLFPHIYRHSGRPIMHLQQFAGRLYMPTEPFRRIVEAGLGPWLPVPTPGEQGVVDYWFIKDMLPVWRGWLLGSGPAEELVKAKQIVVNWDRSQRERDYSFLDHRNPGEYFRYFLDREYVI